MESWKAKLIFTLLLLAGLWALFRLNASAQSLQNKWTLADKVKEGQLLLKNSPSLKFIEKRGKLIRKQISLAILNIETGEVTESRYWLDVKDIDTANLLRRQYKPNQGNLPRFMPVNPAEEFEVINDWWNGWASYWSLEKSGSQGNDIYVVVADKYLLENSAIFFAEDKTGAKYSDIIFTPPSDGVHDNESVGAGVEFLQKVDEAFRVLGDLKVESRAFPGKLIVDTIDPLFVRNILIVEQTDPDAILNRAKTEEEQRHVAEKVLVRYGLNGEKSYRYTVSSAGAVGPAQIMRTTYTNRAKKSGILERYPEAKLIKDPNLGRVDFVNAVMAEILVFDDHLMGVRRRVENAGPRAEKVFYSLSPNQLNEVRAMIYNGGEGKYNLATGGLNTRSPGAGETADFLRKLRIIQNLNLFN